jgi:hypothetical protein
MTSQRYIACVFDAYDDLRRSLGRRKECEFGGAGGGRNFESWRAK